MVQFFRNALLFLLIAIALDRLGGAVFDRLFARTRVGQGSGVVNTMLEHRNDPILVFGNSRARQHIDPDVLASITGLEAYNAGANGQGLPYARGVQALALHRGAKNRCHVLHLDVVDVVNPQLVRANVLAPFVGTVPAIDELLFLNDPWARLKSWSSLWRYNSVALSILRNQRGRPRKGYRGFDSMKKRRRGFADNREFIGKKDAEAPTEIAARSRQLLSDFVEAARAHGTQVVWITSPMNPGGPTRGTLSPTRTAARNLLTAYAAELGVPYVSYDEQRLPQFRDSDLFVDNAHLQAEGARRLSEIVARDLLEHCP